MVTRRDDPKKKKLDAKLVSLQPHEQKYIAKKAAKSLPAVKKATQQAGPSRKAVMKKLLGK